MPRDQAADAKELYDSRSSTYDASFHTSFARHMVELAAVKPGEHVLDLACGTGLATLVASSAVGPSGRVVGIDVSDGMLAEAKAKYRDHEPQNVSWAKHSITELGTLDAIRGCSFDLIMCCSALVLLEKPGDALREWTKRLRPGGRLLVDVTHPQSQIPGIVFEKVGRELGYPLPWYRLNFQNADDLKRRMIAAGLVDIEMNLLAQEALSGTEALNDYCMRSNEPPVIREYDVSDANSVFEKHISGIGLKCLADPLERRENAKTAFLKEWRSIATTAGKLSEVDGVYVGLGFARGPCSLLA